MAEECYIRIKLLTNTCLTRHDRPTYDKNKVLYVTSFLYKYWLRLSQQTSTRFPLNKGSQDMSLVVVQETNLRFLVLEFGHHSCERKPMKF